MTTVTIFLASSNELQSDRSAFEKFLFEKTMLWRKEKNIFLDLINWENFTDAMAESGLQDKYNSAIKRCDIFVMLYWTKVGKYTLEEFYAAKTQFDKSGKPLIYTYFKTAPPESPPQQSLADFKQVLKDMKHYETGYNNTEGLLYHFNHQLDILYLNSNKEDVQTIVKPIVQQKNEIIAMINKGDLFEAFEALNLIFKGANDSLNALLGEYVNRPGNFVMAEFTMRLKLFISRQIQ